MYRRKFCHRLQLNYYLIIHNQVWPVGKIHSMAIVDHWECRLDLQCQVQLLELDTEKCMVCTLQ